MSFAVKCLVALALFALIAESYGFGYGNGGYGRGGYGRGRGRGRGRGGGRRGYFNKDPCQLRLGIRYHRHQKYRHIRTVPSSCEKGHVDWHYPRGLVSLDFSDYWGSSRPFTICLTEQGASATQNITDITDGYYPTSYNFQRENQYAPGNVCIPSHGSRLRLVLDGGPRVTYYLARISYTREGQHQAITTEAPAPEETTHRPRRTYRPYGSYNGYGYGYPRS